MNNENSSKSKKSNNLKGQKYSSENKNDLNLNITKLSLENIEIKENKSFSYFDFDKKKEIKLIAIINYNKLKKIVENYDNFKKCKLIENSFKNWRNLTNEKEEKNSSEIKENNQIDYEKNVTISEACRGLEDIISDFKIYLIKFFLQNRKKND